MTFFLLTAIIQISIDAGGTGVAKLTAANRGTTRLEQVHVVLILKGVDLLGGETGVGEHAVLNHGSAKDQKSATVEKD